MSELPAMRGRFKLASSIAAAFVLVTLGARADAEGPEPEPAPSGHLGFLLRMNFDFGGDKLADVAWSDGSTGTLRAGQLLTFSGGALYHAVGPWAIEVTFGYKFDKVNGSNGTIEFTRLPLDLIASWAPGNHRLGGGVTFHFAPAFKCQAAGVCADSVSFDTAVGAIAQYAYVLRRQGSSLGLDFGVRYTLIHYSTSSLPSQDGSGPGFFFGFDWI